MASHEDPSVPVETPPVQGNDKSGDIVPRSAFCILPADIETSTEGVVRIRELRYGTSGRIISLEWDERFACLNIDLSVMESYRSKGFLEIGYDILLYLLQFAMHVPLRLLTVQFPKEFAGIGIVTVLFPIEIINEEDDLDCCELCFSDLTLGGRNMLDEGDWGTDEYFEKHGDKELLVDSGWWSGLNYFCDYCWFYKQYVFWYLPRGSTRRQRMLEEYPCRGAYSDNLDSLYETYNLLEKAYRMDRVLPGVASGDA